MPKYHIQEEAEIAFQWQKQYALFSYKNVFFLYLFVMIHSMPLWVILSLVVHPRARLAR